MFREETQMICEKNDIFQKVTKCSINIAGMLNILHKYLNTLLVLVT